MAVNGVDDILLGRALVACSLNANTQIRSRILQLYSGNVDGDQVSQGFQDRPSLHTPWA